MGVTPIDSYDEFKKIINSGKVVIIDFWATWCGPCNVISPVFEQLSNMHINDDVEFYKVDVDAQTEIAQEAGIKAMPTFIAFKNGEQIGSTVGASPPKLTELVNISLSA